MTKITPLLSVLLFRNTLFPCAGVFGFMYVHVSLQAGGSERGTCTQTMHIKCAHLTAQLQCLLAIDQTLPQHVNRLGVLELITTVIFKFTYDGIK